MLSRNLFLAAMLAASPHAEAASPSFDCRAATTAVEKDICGDAHLSRLDADMRSAFSNAYAATSFKQALLAGQRVWLSRRKECGEAHPGDNHDDALMCLRERYARRLAFLRRPLDLQPRNVCRSLIAAITFANGYVGPEGRDVSPTILNEAGIDVLGAITFTKPVRNPPSHLVEELRRLDADENGWPRRYYDLGPPQHRVVVADHFEGTLDCQYTHYFTIDPEGKANEIEKPRGPKNACLDDLTHFADVPSGGPDERAAFVHETPTLDTVVLTVGTWSGSAWSPTCGLTVRYQTEMILDGSACQDRAACSDLSGKALALAENVGKSPVQGGSAAKVHQGVGHATELGGQPYDGLDLTVEDDWYKAKGDLGDASTRFSSDARSYAFAGSNVVFRISHGLEGDVEHPGYIVGAYKPAGDAMEPVAAFAISEVRTGLAGAILNDSSP